MSSATCCWAAPSSLSRSGRSSRCQGLIELSQVSKGFPTREQEAEHMTPRDRPAPARVRMLVLGNETVEDDALHQLIAEHAAGILVVVLVVVAALDRAGE